MRPETRPRSPAARIARARQRVSRAYRTSSVLLLPLLLAAGCGRRAAAGPLPIDLMNELPRAERRAPGVIEQATRTDLVNIGSDVQPALVMEAPARITYLVTMPGAARLRTKVALTANASGAAAGVQIRVGVSDDRFYDELIRLKVPAGVWTPIDLD